MTDEQDITPEKFVRSLAELADMADDAGMMEKADRIATAIPTVRTMKVGSVNHAEMLSILEDVKLAATEHGNERMAAKADQLLKEAQLWDKLKEWYGKGKDWLGKGKDWLGRHLGLGKDKPAKPEQLQTAPLPEEIPLVDDDAESTVAPAEPPPLIEPEPEPEPITEPGPEAVGEIPPKPEPREPGEEFREVKTEPTEVDLLNKTLSLRDKIIKAIYALDGGKKKYLLRIKYTTLKGTRSERDIEPDYVWSAMTGNQILVAWDHLRWDWRGFIVPRISDAMLKPRENMAEEKAREE
jgi:hypothetical protein